MAPSVDRRPAAAHDDIPRSLWHRDELNELGDGIGYAADQIRAASLDPKTGEDVTRYRLDLSTRTARECYRGSRRRLQVSAIRPTTASVPQFDKRLLDDTRLPKHELPRRVGERQELWLRSCFALSSSNRHAEPCARPERSLKYQRAWRRLNAMDLLKNLLFMNTSAAEYGHLQTAGRNW
jgi:hypothetical protein